MTRTPFSSARVLTLSSFVSRTHTIVIPLSHSLFRPLFFFEKSEDGYMGEESRGEGEGERWRKGEKRNEKS